ncbi:hypothetical protein AVEN_5625-1 [Araneus ventricosus]|uniref:Uncharacterized protein n=1 Tax=Araneus ventricosus TaxID=182803 RepID=A0A4Y2Q8R6_ARAVE|nr:hypothetical protein AVEN_5625-1 [Araneus ventricosus]
MAEAKKWEFDCPQFYDFCNGVEDNTVNIHCLGADSPDLESKFNLKSKNLLKNRFTAWNKLSTPVNKSPFINVNRQTNTTDSEKLNERKKRFSKSEGSVNVVGACGNVLKKDSYCPGFTRKRSISDGNIRPKKKYPITPKKAPATPMCLKRTLKKDRVKKLKSTEELELEKIAQLQSLTLKHLRLNEMNMKKLKLKPKPTTVPKLAPFKSEKTEKSAPVKKFQKDLEEVIKRLNRNTGFLDSNQTKRSERLGAVSSVSDVDPVGSSRTLQPSVSGLLSEVQMVVDDKDIINELSFKKYPAHSGLFFHQNNSKTAALKPFNFHDRPEVLSKSTVKVNKENMQLTKAQFSHSFHTSRIKNRNDKENNFCMKVLKSDAGIIKKSFKF